GTERFDHQTITGQVVGAANEAFDIDFIEIDDLGNEKNLPRYTGLIDRFLQSLINDAFMRGVLVDDHQAFGGLGNDVGIMNLSARGPEGGTGERAVARLFVRSFHTAAVKGVVQVCRRSADIKSRWRGCGETAMKRRKSRADFSSAVH